MASIIENASPSNTVRLPGTPLSLRTVAGTVSSLLTLCAGLSATEAGAKPPLPTPCLAAHCGTSATGFVQYGAAGGAAGGTTMNVAQTTSKAILNWADFNIANGYTVNFVQ